MPAAGKLRLVSSRVILLAALLVATQSVRASEPTFERDVLLWRKIQSDEMPQIGAPS